MPFLNRPHEPRRRTLPQKIGSAGSHRRIYLCVQPLPLFRHQRRCPPPPTHTHEMTHHKMSLPTRLLATLAAATSIAAPIVAAALGTTSKPYARTSTSSSSRPTRKILCSLHRQAGRIAIPCINTAINGTPADSARPPSRACVPPIHPFRTHKEPLQVFRFSDTLLVFLQSPASRDARPALELHTISRLMAHLRTQRAHPRGRACPPFTVLCRPIDFQLRILLLLLPLLLLPLLLLGCPCLARVRCLLLLCRCRATAMAFRK
jgi:hypothetical protein